MLTLSFLLLLSIHPWILFPPLPVISSCMQISEPLDLQGIERLILPLMFIPSLKMTMKVILEGVSFACK
jgi:hypothetical protein